MSKTASPALQTPTLEAKPGRPRLDRDARREAILDVAQEVFLEEGFGAASMSTIAARLGGSKGTLYNYFKSKDELFRAYVERRCLWQDEIFLNPPANETAEQQLMRLGRGYLSHIMTDTNLRNFRLIAAESDRSPEIGRIFYDTGPRRGVQRLAAELSTMAARGLLDLDDPETAAHQLIGLAQSRYWKALLCNAIPELTPDQIEAETASAARTFLRAYAPR